MPTTIAITDDKAINRTTLQQKLHPFSDLQVVFMAVNGDDCLEQLKGLPFSKHPQVIFMDLEMPGLNGIQTIQIAKSLYPHIHFIVLTVFDDDEKIFEAIKSGASGYMLKDETGKELYQAVISCNEYGGAPMSPAIARKALDMLGKSNYTGVTTLNEDVPVLSEREKEILQHTIHGFDAKENIRSARHQCSYCKKTYCKYLSQASCEFKSTNHSPRA